MERFLRYSLEHGRAIRLIWLDDQGVMRQANVLVTALTPSTISIQSIRPRQNLTLTPTQILSADYRKGDEGQA